METVGLTVPIMINDRHAPPTLKTETNHAKDLKKY